jgi:DNA adenine methylase
MILRRLGNKNKIADKIISYFPKHSIYIEMFFGTGAIYFRKNKAQKNFLNDIDGEVYNVFNVLMTKKNELKKFIELMPVHQLFWDEIKKASKKENKDVINFNNEIERAVAFLFLSNFGFLGKPVTLRFGTGNSKKELLRNLEIDYIDLVQSDNSFLNCDFREVLKKISFRDKKEIANAFCYCDPPYLGTENNYSNSFFEKDSLDLLDILETKKIKMAMSEFDNDFIIAEAKKRKLNIINIGTRKNLKNRRNEILITNYHENSILF